jgi:ribonucrease Y
VELVVPILAILAIIILVGFVTLKLNEKSMTKTFEDAQQESKVLLEEARKEADRIIHQSNRDARDEVRKKRHSFDDESKARRSEISKLENKVKSRETALEKKLSAVDKKEGDLERATQQNEQLDARYKRLISETEKQLEDNRRVLQGIAQMTAEEAKRELMNLMADDAKKECQKRIQDIEEQTRQQADKLAQSMISLAVQRIASEHVNDSTISVVSLPSEDMKGRIIGREGRNIRAIEQATGVDLIIDDTPEAVIISCFNPIRREVAKVTLERLIADGRIHPARIDETAKRVETEFEQIIQENGEQAAFEAGITDLHPELLKMLGKLRYRSTGQQSVLQHAVEVSHICGIMASEMGLNVKLAKRAGLLHDVGKAAGQEAEGHHAHLSAEICAKHRENDVVIEAVRLHHQEDLGRASAYAVVVHAANTLSANRPGARKEVLESYIKRLESMETIVQEFSGIDSAYVLQAGREVRAIVTPSGVSDDEIIGLSNDIASKLRHELSFPGQVQVTVVRESRFVDYAK